MVLTKDDQQTLASIEAIEKEKVVVPQEKDLPNSQPFVNPVGVHDHGMADVSAKLNMPLKRCKRRYVSIILLPVRVGISPPPPQKTKTLPTYAIVFQNILELLE